MNKIQIIKPLPVYLVAILIALISVQCKQNKRRPSQQEVYEYQKKLVDVHRNIVSQDADSIKSIITRNGWDMQQTGTGLWYEIYQKSSSGDSVKSGKQVSMEYDVYLIDSTLCYSSDSLGPKTFIAGQGGIESGIEEGILLMKTGDRARFILPPHLAHGIHGDDNKIPRLAIIMYDVYINWVR